MKKQIKISVIFIIAAGIVYLFGKPICQIFSAVYNFVQTNSLFTSNLFNFILVAAFFIWLLFYFIDVVGVLDKKSKETAKTITDAENKKIEAQKYLSDTQNSLKNTDNEVKNIVSDAQATAKNIEKNSQNKLDEELANLKNREELLKNAQIDKAKEEVSVVIANAAVAVSKEYIKNTLDEKMHKKLIMNFINDLDEDMVL